MEQSNEPKTLYRAGRIDISAIGSDAQLRLGDLNGDGRLEIVALQPDSGIDDQFLPHSLSAAIAYTLEGEVLWQLGTPDTSSSACPTDLPAQIYDIDRDGMNEFICVMDGMLCIYDGKTAELKRQIELPDPQAHDCIIIADVEGKGYPQNLILKNRFHQLWVLDSNFNVLWTYKGNIGHVPVACDLNGDGRDEIIAGKVILSADGEVLTAFDLPDFPQSIYVGSILSETQTEQTVILLGGKETAAYSSSGELLGRLKTPSDTDQLTIGSFRGGQTVQFAGFYADHGDDSPGSGIFLTDYRGNTLFKEGRSELTPEVQIQTIYNFDGEYRDMLLLSRRSGAAAGIFDGYLNPLYLLPEDGSAICADLLGDGIPQILVTHNGIAELYSASPVELGKPVVPYSRPQPQSLYNETIFSCRVCDPSRNALLLATAATEHYDDIFSWAEAAALDPSGDTPISRADFLILMTTALNLHAYDADGYSDVSPRDYYYDAVSTIKKLGYMDEVVGRFNPQLAATAEFADQILKKADITPITVKSGADELTRTDAAKFVLQIRTQKNESTQNTPRKEEE